MHGYLDVRDKFRNFGIFPVKLVVVRPLVFFGVVTRFGNKERSAGIGDIGKFTGLEEFILEEDDIANVRENLVLHGIIDPKLRVIA